jgi:membrane protein YqaA with SNARE-associated domain
MIDISILANILTEYGLVGLFLSSLIGSTIFIPFTVEIFLAGLIKLGANPILAISIATIGSWLGNMINYFIGLLGARILEKKGKDIEKAKKFANKYGLLGLFIIISFPFPIPFPVDILTVFAGIARMRLLYFSLIIFFGKLIKYSIIAELIMVI